MKKRILLLLTAALLLSGCAKEPAPAPELPVIEPAPELPPSGQEPLPEPEPAPEQLPPAPAPETSMEPAPSPEPEPETGNGIIVRDSEMVGTVEESISYSITVPKLEGSGDGVTSVNAYYEQLANKLYGMAYGEIYEQSLDQHTILHLSAAFTVKRNDGKLLSIYRSAAVYDMGTGSFNTGVQYAEYAETFDMETGGLLTPSGIFDAEQAVYTERLVENVKRYIREHPGSDSPGSVRWKPEWETLAVERFDPNRFYLTDDAYVVFYDDGDLGEGEGTNEFFIPWRQLADILKIEVS